MTWIKLANDSSPEKTIALVGLMARTCNPSAQEAEEGGLLAGGQPDLHSDGLKQNRKLEQREKKSIARGRLNLMLVPEYSNMLIEMLCYQENRFFYFAFCSTHNYLSSLS